MVDGIRYRASGIGFVQPSTNLRGDTVTLNLQIVLAIMGVVVVLVVYLVSRRQNRVQPPYRKSPGLAAATTTNTDPNPVPKNPAAGKGAPGEWSEIPVPETPVYSGRSRAADGATTVAESEMPPPPNYPKDTRTPVFGAATSPRTEGDAGEFYARPVDGFGRLSQIDYWARITGERDVGRETVLALYRKAAAGFSKSCAIHGVKSTDTAWCNVEEEAEDSRFADLIVTIQLADCDGAVSEREMARFSALVSRLSTGTGREFTLMAPVECALAQADSIAAFARHFDSVFVVNIHPEDGERFHGPAIDRYAPQMGLERDNNHYYSRFKAVGRNRVALYSLADQSDTGHFDFVHLKSFSTHGLTFFTRPAVNRSPGAVFTEMVDTARAFASRIKGTVNSPTHGDLTQEDVESIRQSIEGVAAEMERLGIPAGSDEATRIF